MPVRGWRVRLARAHNVEARKVDMVVSGTKRRFANINAKAEGIESKPAFRKAFERRRCLVPVDNFYEWKKTATGKQPYAKHQNSKRRPGC